jgi:Zn-dependent protease
VDRAGFVTRRFRYNETMSDSRRDPAIDPVDWSTRAGESESDELEPRDVDWARLADERAEELEREYAQQLQREYDEQALRDYRPIHPEPAWRMVVRRLWAPIAVVGALLWKFKAAAVAVFKFKFVGTALSGLVSVAAYALLWSWWFAIGLVVLLFVHEMGHVLEARRQGLPVSAPMFIPFLGALISLRQLPHDVWREARLALAGPIVGTVGALAFWAVGVATDRDFFIAMAYVGFFLNLFNLLPIVPLDGGRAVAALHPAFWLLGLIGLAALLVLTPNPILILILIIGGMELWNRWRHRGSQEALDYYRISPGKRVAVAVTYLGLAALLVVFMGATHIERDL